MKLSLRLAPGGVNLPILPILWGRLVQRPQAAYI